MMHQRRLIYLFVFIALAIPFLTDYSLRPARMAGADRLFDVVEGLPTDKAAFVAFDFGPNTVAENGAQADVVFEHLMRRRVPVLLFSQYVLGEGFLESIPRAVVARLEKEMPGQRWVYGTDWVNLGYRPGGYLAIQAIPKAADLRQHWKRDARGNSLDSLPIMKNIETFEALSILLQFTGLLGVFDIYVQFFQNESHRPLFGHGCTSITIPEAFIYLDSGQLNGLLEGIAGAAWYSARLSEANTERAHDKAIAINTGLGVAHLLIIALIVVGNCIYWGQRFHGGRL